jgi:glycosyltransferase involved in cell wall biosynthesis
VRNDKSFHVLHIDTGLDWRGGQQQVYLLHRELLRRGISSALLARTGGELQRVCESDGLPVTGIRGRLPWPTSDAVAMLKAARAATIVHAHDSHAMTLAALARSRRRVIVCHRRVSFHVRPNLNRRWKYTHVGKWIAVSEEIAEGVRRAGVPADRIVVVPSALDVDALRRAADDADLTALRSELDLGGEAPVVGVTGALEPHKGHEVLVAAAPTILEAAPSAIFLLLGDGSLRDRLTSEVDRRGLTAAFRFAGFRRDVAAVTSLYTVAVLPSIAGEGSSAALKEAMALATPVVASDLSGNREVLGGCGLEVPAADPGALAEGVVQLLSDAALRKRLGRAGAERASLFRPDGMTDAVVAVYRGLMGERPGARQAP